ncbi:MAG TPA: MFS transporter, partial [Oligoflexia bacterium]|nr:MFS transporter [Oligoflexia bacterium]
MQQKWLILSAVGCGTFMATLDSSIVNVALPSITTDFRTGLSFSRWVVIAYLFSITGLLLFFGKMADIIGRKLIFKIGFVIFTFGSLICGLAETINQLILFRGIQGFGAAMIMANGPAIITGAFPASERGKALGTLAMIVSAGLAIGPFLGGLFVKYFSWRSIFFVNIPIGFLGTYLVHRYVPTAINPQESAMLEREARLPFGVRIQIYLEKLRHFDWLGAILWMFAQLGYSLAIDQTNALGLGGPLQRIVSFSAAAMFFLFLIWESSIKDPVLDLNLFRSRSFLAANISSLLNFIGISSVTLLMPFYFQNVRGLPPDQVGLLMTAIPATIFFVAPISGRLSDKYGSRVLSAIGMLVLCSALAMLAIPGFGLQSDHPFAVVFYLTLVGAGIGLFQAPNNNALMSSVAKQHLGVASALLATVRNFGLVTGAAMSTSLLMHFYGEQIAIHGVASRPVDNFTAALRFTFIAIAAFCAIGVLTSLLREDAKSN